MSSSRSNKSFILGLGNVLKSDDGAGVHAVRSLLEAGWSPETCIEIGAAPLKAQAILEEAEEVLIVDAIQAQSPPGTIHCLNLEQVALNQREGLHELSVAGVLALIPAERRPRGRVVGIEPQSLDYGMELSPVVARAMPLLITKIKNLWKHEHHESNTTRPCL